MLLHRLASVFICLQLGGSAPLLNPARDGASRSQLLSPASRLLRRLHDRKRAQDDLWVAPGRSEDLNWKRAPNGLGAAGFHGDVFSQGFGAFSPVKRGRRPAGLRPEVGARELDGDVFNGGLGYFNTMKRRPEMDASGFHGDVFNGGLGYFDTMKRRPEMDASGFHGDVFNGGLGYFDTMKRRPEMDASGFHGDVFNGGLGYFDTMKRRPEMDASGFHSDVFSGGLGHFDTMKRRPADGFRSPWPAATSHATSSLPNSSPVKIAGGPGADRDLSEAHADGGSTSLQAALASGLRLPPHQVHGEKRAAAEAMTAKGFHGDLFSGGLNRFDTMR